MPAPPTQGQQSPEWLAWLERQARGVLGPHGYQAVQGFNQLLNPVPGLMDAVVAPGRMMRGEVDPLTGVTQIAGGLLDAAPAPAADIAMSAAPGILGMLKGPGWIPQRVFRGEHGELTEAPFQSRVGSYTFVDSPEGASLYAMHPNDFTETALAPRVYPAQVNIKKPLFNETSGDPFVEFDQVAETLGRDKAIAYFKKHADWAENTSNWHDRVNKDGQFASAAEFLDKHPERANELYLEAYGLLDDPDFIADARKAGYDGAIYGSSGETAGYTEYRIFDPDQAVPMFGED